LPDWFGALRLADCKKIRSRPNATKEADDWELNLERWTATTNGPIRAMATTICGITENDDPNDGGKIEINSGGGVYDEREIVDAGFLELCGRHPGAG